MAGRVERGRDALSNTLVAVRATVVRRDARALLVGVSLLYLGLYLYALGHLRFTGNGVDYVAVSDPLSRMFRSTGTLSFEPVAGLVVGPVELLVAPVNIAIGGALALLVGTNLAVSYLAWRHPVACGVGGGGAKGSGLLAGLPALLSGTACCGPVVLVALGVQASGLLLATFDLLVPAAALLLLGSLVSVGRSVDQRVAASRTAGADDPRV